MTEMEEVIGPDYKGAAEKTNPYYPKQKDLENLIRDFGLKIPNAELLSTLKQWNLLYETV